MKNVTVVALKLVNLVVISEMLEANDACMVYIKSYVSIWDSSHGVDKVYPTMLSFSRSPN